MVVAAELRLPGTIVPMATANAMLIIGSSKNNCDCDFPLHLFLIVTGGIGLAILVMEALAQHVLRWILEDSQVTRIERRILVIIHVLGWLLTFLQITALIAGSILVFDAYPYVHFEKPATKICFGNETMEHFLPPHSPGLYCDYSMFMFTFCLVIMVWIFLIIAFLCFAYIWFGLRRIQDS